MRSSRSRISARCGGHDVDVTADGKSAVERATSEPKPEIAIVDIGLPGIDGYEVARRMRAAGSAAFLVALTGYGAPEQRELAIAAGFDVHLVKPVDPGALQELLARKTKTAWPVSRV